jgi:hypothetical protein
MQCDRCSEYSIGDATFKRVEDILAEVDSNAELEDHPIRGVTGSSNRPVFRQSPDWDSARWLASG